MRARAAVSSCKPVVPRGNWQARTAARVTLQHGGVDAAFLVGKRTKGNGARNVGDHAQLYCAPAARASNRQRGSRRAARFGRGFVSEQWRAVRTVAGNGGETEFAVTGLGGAEGGGRVATVTSVTASMSAAWLRRAGAGIAP